MIKFAGIRSDDMNLIVEHYPQKIFPERSYEVIEVPGRDGDIVIDNGNFKNYRQSYSVFIDSNDPDEAYYQRVTSKIAEWLLSNPGYQRLEDSYDPEFYRMAYYSGGSNFSNFFNTYGRGTIEFTCAPRRYYKTGDEIRSLDNGNVLHSPSEFRADPIYIITASSSSPSISVNGNSFTLTGVLPGSDITIDTQNHTAKYANGTNAMIYSGVFEHLQLPKESTISFTGASALRIKPGWWTL